MAGKNLAPGWYDIAAIRIQAGWSAHLLTFMFHPLRGRDHVVGTRQAALVEEAYSRFVTRADRSPTRPGSFLKLPVWICAPDFPVPKSHSVSRENSAVNNGRHMHAFAVTPPFCRLRVDLAEHFASSQHLYARTGGISRLHAEPITHDPMYVFDYGAKAVIRGRADPSSLLVLPRTTSEVRGGAQVVGRNSSLYRGV